MADNTTKPEDFTPIADVKEAQTVEDGVYLTTFSRFILSSGKKNKRETQKLSDICGTYLTSSRNLQILSDLLDNELKRVFTSSGKAEHKTVLVRFKNCIDTITGDTVNKKTGEVEKTRPEYGYFGEPLSFKGVDGHGTKVNADVIDPQGQTGYKPMSIQSRDIETKEFDPFKYLSASFEVCLKKLDNESCRDLSKDELITLSELLESCNTYNQELKIKADCSYKPSKKAA